MLNTRPYPLSFNARSRVFSSPVKCSVLASARWLSRNCKVSDDCPYLEIRAVGGMVR